MNPNPILRCHITNTKPSLCNNQRYTDCLCVIAHSKVAAIWLQLQEQLIASCNRAFTLSRSITPAFTEVGCVLCSPPQSAELALHSDISKLDCTGLKIDPFRNRWAYIAVLGLILKWKSHAIA